MVRLEKIVMQGFKSFKRKVSIPLPTGFSVITGPNGSGKSNILDGICFVLGTSSSRALRARKAKDLIFHGSKERAGSDYAIVSLYFDNSDGTLPLKEKTATISRRINKKGVSTYRLNGKIVTRQQILDLFSVAHIQPDGHNIIQQGDVNQIVEMDAVERRGIIDEISGIKEYDDKKQKAEKELEKIAEKVKGAEILLQEKSSTMEKMKREYESAMAYKNLTSELQKIRAAIIWKSYSGSEERLKKISSMLEEKTKESESLEKKIEEYDKRLQDEESRLEELTKDIVEASNQIEVSKRIAKIRAELESKQEMLESKKREIERITDMIERIKSIDARQNPAVRAIKGMKGVLGTVSELVDIPGEYRIAAEVAAGSHFNDVITDSMTTAVRCVNHLKKNRIGRARFLPLNRIRPSRKGAAPPGTMGWMSDLVRYEARYSAAMEYVFGTTACVKDIETAKRISAKYRVRLVTLDGDLVEASGAVTGGFFRKRRDTPQVNDYINQKRKLEEDIERIEEQIRILNRELEGLAEKEKKTKSITFEKERIRIDEKLKKIRDERKEAYEKRIMLQQEIGRLNIQKARIEASFENFKVQWEEFEKKKEEAKQKEGIETYTEMAVSTLKSKEKEVMEKINALGLINMKVLEEFDTIKNEFEEFKEKVDKIVEEKKSIEETIEKIESKRRDAFMKTLEGISKNFKEVYKQLTGGDAELSLEDPNNIESGLLISASPPGKKLLHIDSMSGGEKTLTAFAFLFAIQRHRPAPFYVLDEADATLDRMNTKRIADLLKKQAKEAQFIIISHNDNLVREADQIYGITMEAGESKVIGVKLPQNN